MQLKPDTEGWKNSTKSFMDKLKICIAWSDISPVDPELWSPNVRGKAEHNSHMFSDKRKSQVRHMAATVGNPENPHDPKVIFSPFPFAEKKNISLGTWYL